MTVFKAQGKSFAKVIIDIESCRSLQAVYVMLSHVQSLSGLLVLRPFRRQRITSRQSEDMQYELKRQRYLHSQTKLRSSSDNASNDDINNYLALHQMLSSTQSNECYKIQVCCSKSIGLH